MNEAELPDGAWSVRPPARDEPVRVDLAEEVEGQRLRPEQVGPEALMVEALARLDVRRPRPSCGERAGTDEVGAPLARVVERQPAADESRGLPGLRNDRLRADRVSMCLAPLRLVKAQQTAELCHCRAARNSILRLPAVRRFELRLVHALAP